MPVSARYRSTRPQPNTGAPPGRAQIHDPALLETVLLHPAQFREFGFAVLERALMHRLDAELRQLVRDDALDRGAGVDKEDRPQEGCEHHDVTFM